MTSTPQANLSKYLPPDYLERVYAGVLGKLVGVYMGRPFEGWTHQRILAELGHIRYYVHDKFNEPLVVVDDDISGTFQFIRALEEHGVSDEITSEDIGRTWLNTVIEDRAIFWWGGRGVSTEHTAFLNLKSGIRAPSSGSCQTNGKTVSEQIGAQIFIDGWGIVSPGNPLQAAKLAHAAGSVSHDGESVYAAQLWAAMEAEAFVSRDVDHLLDTGLSVIPRDSLVTHVVGMVREWAKDDGDWLKTRKRIEDSYGYDKFHGVCHVIPNHAIMIMTVIYAGHDFDEAMHIINTCGWDTDCNSGNVGCLVAIMLGLTCFEGKHDWREPLVDRVLLSTAEVGYSINNAARIAIDIANMGRQLAEHSRLPPPKEGAQFHFGLPGSVQGFQVVSQPTPDNRGSVTVRQDVDVEGNPSLAIHLDSMKNSIEVSTPVFGSLEELTKSLYSFSASPLLYPGQTISAKFLSDVEPGSSAKVGLRVQAYGEDDSIKILDGPSISARSGSLQSLSWTVPDETDGRPLQRVGLCIQSTGPGSVNGTIWLDSLRWDGSPRLVLRRPSTQPGQAWHLSWINNMSKIHPDISSHSLVLSQSHGEGIAVYGARDWTNYRILVPKLKVSMGAPVGVAVRVQGLNRYYALLLIEGRRVALVKAKDEQRITLASVSFDWRVDGEYDFALEADGTSICGKVQGIEINASDDQYSEGGIGLVVTEGAICVDSIEISPLGN
ncbi:ADP-ribosylglycohydrolase family protein [Aspergillus foveolatus]|uniref:ADP-ribosylglycohydrolase family protein n=1 Tax=Aspergillus foveolatus TaxID=210207 RepID=UPI003CCD5768